MVLIRCTLAALIVIFLTIPSYIYVYKDLFHMLNSEEKANKFIYNIRKCDRPFVQVGNSCYFFSDTHKPIEYYKIKYKGRFYSVPKKLDWLHTLFACETLDRQAHPISVESVGEIQNIGKYMLANGFYNLYTVWSSGHRARMSNMAIDSSTMVEFFWYTSTESMNFTYWISGQPVSAHFPEGFCMNLQLVNEEVFMSTMNCHEKLAYICEREL